MDPAHRKPTLAAREPVPAGQRITLTPCAWCAGQRSILEPSILGLVPVVCGRCDGHGRERHLGVARRP